MDHIVTNDENEKLDKVGFGVWMIDFSDCTDEFFLDHLMPTIIDYLNVNETI